MSLVNMKLSALAFILFWAILSMNSRIERLEAAVFMTDAEMEELSK